jgi:hypothetical protein
MPGGEPVKLAQANSTPGRKKSNHKIEKDALFIPITVVQMKMDMGPGI